MGNTYKHLTLEERVEIYRLWKQGISMRKIATEMRRDVGSISRELKRNRSRHTKTYTPVTAEEMSQKRTQRQRTKAPLKNIQIFTYVRENLKEKQWSPEIIAGRLSIDLPGEHIVPETIYQYIYGKGRKYHLEQYLVKGHKKRRMKTGRSVQKTQSKIPNAIMIDKRPTKANNRTQIGHFETDLMEGPRGNNTVLCVTVERKSRYTVIGRVSNKKTDTVQNILQKKLQPLQSLSKAGKPIVRSVTSDNGCENTNHERTSEQLSIDWYFCYPYHSWEKGSVENRIGVIRRFIPKGTPLHTYTEQEIQHVENKLNTTPMKCLGFQTPEEVFQKETNRYKFKRFKKSKCCTSS